MDRWKPKAVFALPQTELTILPGENAMKRIYDQKPRSQLVRCAALPQALANLQENQGLKRFSK